MRSTSDAKSKGRAANALAGGSVMTVMDRLANVPAQCDVLVVGSGAAGLMAGNRAADLGLDTLVIERSELFGGTTALSGGGIWVPCNDDIGDADSAEQAMAYLRAASAGKVPEARLRAYVEGARAMLAYLQSQVGVACAARAEFADYMQHLPGASAGGRTVFPRFLDAGQLGDEFFRLRPTPLGSRLMGRINLAPDEGRVLTARGPGWRRLFVRLMAAYWLDLGWRRKTRQDRRLGMGIGLIAGLRLGLLHRKVPLLLNTRLVRLVREGGRVTGAVVERDGNAQLIATRRGVILGSGGFEQNQALRDSHLPGHTDHRWSLSPPGNNAGDALLAGEAIGADSAFLDYAWWCPSVRIPARDLPNAETRSGMFAERSFPHSLCVNREGRRFANEALSYHDFGLKMLEDQARSGANIPCWLIFDAQFRAKFPLGSILPARLMPDGRIPPQWWGSVLHRADSIAALAEATGIAPQALEDTVARFNGFARSGVDEDFARGQSAYDSVYCDKRHKPNPSLGEVARAPFYAVRLDLGDIGTMGGLLADENGQVIDRSGQPIAGLYAAGNCSSAFTGGTYPGAGATLGGAMTFAYLAANHLAALGDAAAIPQAIAERQPADLTA